jgi:hypothetical protein
MSDTIIALVIPIVMVAIIFRWVPLLNLIFPPRRDFSDQRHFQDIAYEMHPLFLSRISASDFTRHRENLNAFQQQPKTEG